MAAALVEFLKTTSARLNAEGFEPDEQLLKKKVMPSVEEGIRRLSGGAPAAIRGKLKSALEEFKVYPSFEADVDELRSAVAKCLLIVGGEGPTSTAKAEPEEAAPFEQKQEEAEEEADEEEEAAGDMDDPFAMMGGMGEEEVYQVKAIQEATEEELAASKARQEQMAEAAKVEEGEPATNGAKAPGAGGKALKDYLESTITRLSADGFAPEEKDLKGKIMPSVVDSFRRMSAPAPAELRNKLKEALMNAKVMPAYEADLDTFCGALQTCLEALEE